MRSSSVLDRQRTDVSRLLDPSYSSYSPPSSAAYVDAHGDLHDPDYRHFPLIPTPRSQKRLSGGNSNTRIHNPRPHWELVEEDALLSDDDDLLDDDDNTSFLQSRQNRRYSPSYTSPRINYPTSRRSSGATSPSRLGGLYSGYGATSSTRGLSNYYSTASHEMSPPTSYDSSHDTVLSTSATSQSSPFEEKRGCFISSLKKKRRRSSSATAEKEKESMRSIESEAPPRPSFSSSRLSRMDEHDDHILDEEEEEEEDQEEQQDKEEWVPTCSQSMRRQWQAISLRFRFGVFRAQRNLKERVHSLI